MFIGNNIKFKQAIIKYGLPSGLFKNEKELFKFIQDFQPWVNGTVKTIDEDHVHFAINLKAIKATYQRCIRHNLEPNNNTKLDWKHEISVALNRHNYIIDTLTDANFAADVYSPFLTLSHAAKLEINNLIAQPALKIVHSMEPQKKGKELAEIEDFEGGTITIYCKECKKGRQSHFCKHPLERKTYMVRLYIPGLDSEVKRSLTARFRNEAISEATELKTNLQNNGYTNTEKQKPVINKIEYLSQAIQAYKLERERRQGTVFTKNICTPNHIKELARVYSILETGLKAKGYTRFRLTNLNQKEGKNTIDELYKWLTEEVYTKEDAKAKKIPAKKAVGDRKYSNGYINKMTRIWSSLFIWLNDEFMLSIYNPFKKGKKLAHKPNPKAMDDDQFIELIEWMGKEPKLPVHPNKKISAKDLNWLLQVFLLQHFYGVRPEDILQIKWSDVRKEKGFYFVDIANWKATRIKKDDEIERQPFQIADETLKLFFVWGLEENIGKDEFIILPERLQVGKKQSRKNLITKTYTGFTFFAKCLFGQDFSITNRAIRKDNLTGVYDEHREDATKLSRHKQLSTLLKYYVDKNKLALKRAQRNAA